MNKKTVTAGEMAERFGVSTRTIYRDIDVLSASGVPVYATPGTNGGISILEDYTINRTTLSKSEKDSILFALQTLQTTKYPEIDKVLEKLGGIFKSSASDWILIDFSPWGSNPNADNKFADIKASILQSRVIEIEYLNSFNEQSARSIEPLRLLFKSQAWYLWGYCRKRSDYRTFRISRVKSVRLTDETFNRGVAHEIHRNPDHNEATPTYVHLILEFTTEAMYRLCDDYDRDMIRANGDGTYTVEADYPEDEWVYGYILSFGAYVRVIEPEHIRKIIRDRSAQILSYYD